MSILVDQNSRVVVCGITGKIGRLHAQKCLDYGTRIVAGVSPCKNGFFETQSVKIPLFDNVLEAKNQTGANVALLFVPPAFAADSIFECIEAEMPLIICVTEGIPIQDMVRVKARLSHSSSRLIGPNCPGILSPGKCNVSIMPTNVALPGRVGIVSRSGTLTYEAMWQLTRNGIGQSTCVGIGGDPVIGTKHEEMVQLFNEDPETDAIVMIGEIGGDSEIQAADYIQRHVKKPVIAYIAGISAPKGKRMGHAGAIITGENESAQAKINYLRERGIFVADIPSQIAKFFR